MSRLRLRLCRVAVATPVAEPDFERADHLLAQLVARVIWHDRFQPATPAPGSDNRLDCVSQRLLNVADRPVGAGASK